MSYEESVAKELKAWQKKMSKHSITDRVSKAMQNRINRVIPGKIYTAITVI